jgi:hypothetical protein
MRYIRSTSLIENSIQETPLPVLFAYEYSIISDNETKEILRILYAFGSKKEKTKEWGKLARREFRETRNNPP